MVNLLELCARVFINFWCEWFVLCTVYNSIIFLFYTFSFHEVYITNKRTFPLYYIQDQFVHIMVLVMTTEAGKKGAKPYAKAFSLNHGKNKFVITHNLSEIHEITFDSLSFRYFDMLISILILLHFFPSPCCTIDLIIRINGCIEDTIFVDPHMINL